MYRTLLLLMLLTTLLFSQTHPRLFFGPEAIPVLREKLNQSPFDEIAANIEYQAENETEGSEWYQHSYRAVNSGFMYILTGDTTWAAKSRGHVTAIINNGEWADSGVKGLALYMYEKGVAIAYDFCYDAWPADYRDWVAQKLVENANVIVDHGGKSQNTNPASNWQGNRFSSAGLGYLATDADYDAADLQTCWEKVVTYYRENVGDDPESRGWNIEGLGYTNYPYGNFIGPFGVAMQRNNPRLDIRDTMVGAAWMPWTVYANGCRVLRANGKYGLHPDWGDDNPHLNGEGTLGLAFWQSPDELVPGLKYWYDRLVGLQGDESFDDSRNGAIYSYLFYPADVTEQDPMSIDLWLDGFVDNGGNGYYTYRNQYKDSTDMVAQLYTKRRGNKGHSGPDALSFRIFGYDTPWAVGGGRYGPKINGHDAYWSSMNTLYPRDPESAELDTYNTSGRVVGEPFLAPDGSGHVISEIRQNNVGVMGHKRWFVSNYSDEIGCEAVYVIGDQSSTGTYWQICTLVSQAITFDAEANTFMIQGEHGSSMKGWILYQSGENYMTSGTRIRGSNYWYHDTEYNQNNYLHFGSDDGDYLVVLTLATAQQEHPQPTLSGQWPGTAIINIDQWQVTLHEDSVSYANTTRVGTQPELPMDFLTVRNYPNPFNPETTIVCMLRAQAHLNVQIINMQGQVVRQLFSGQAVAGEHQFHWDGRSQAGIDGASGVYFCRVQSGEQIKQIRMLLLR